MGDGLVTCVPSASTRELSMVGRPEYGAPVTVGIALVEIVNVALQESPVQPADIPPAICGCAAGAARKTVAVAMSA